MRHAFGKKCSQIFRVLALVFLCVIALNIIFPLASATKETMAAPTPSETTLAMTTPTVALVLNVDDVDGTFAASSPSDFTVFTNNYTGYTLSIKAKVDDNNSSKLVNGNHVLNSITAATADETGFDIDDWGYKPSKLNSLDNTNYLPAPTFAGSNLNTTSSANAMADTYSLAIAAKADFATAMGTYTNTFVLTAVANLSHYEITYSPNATSGVSNLSATQSGDIAGLQTTISATTPLRSGFSFIGWCNTATTKQNYTDQCPGTTYQPGATFDLDQTTGNSLGLTAMWKQTTFNVTYNLNGGTASGNPSSYSTSDSSIPINDATKSGKTFLGWTGSNDLSSGLSSYTTSNPVIASGRDHRLGNDFAVIPGMTYRVFVVAKRTSGTLNMNGGLFYTAQTSGYPYDGYGTSYTLAESLSNGWGRYYRDVTVPAGKQRAQFYVQLEQCLSGQACSTAWQLADIHVIQIGAEVSSGLDKYTTSSPYTAASRDHVFGNEFNITPGLKYRSYVTAKRTAGSINMRGGIWYSTQTSGHPADGYAVDYTLDAALSDGWSRYYRDVTVPSGKQKGRMYVQLEQSAPNYTTSWLLADMHVIQLDITAAIPSGSTGDKNYVANWK